MTNQFKIRLFILMILVTSLFLTSKSERIIKLDYLVNPNAIQVMDRWIYISDRAKIHLLDLERLTRIKTFGKEGNGPKSFRLNRRVHAGGVDISFSGKNLIINSVGKITFFTKDGRFIREIPTRRSYGRYLWILDQFIGFKGIQDTKGIEYNSYRIYDGQLGEKMELYRKLSWDENRRLDPIRFTQWPQFHVHRNRIYINGQMERGEILVFDIQGKRLKTIQVPIQKLSFNQRDLNRFEAFFNRSGSAYRGFFKQYRRIIRYPDQYPVIRDFFISGERLYILAYSQPGRHPECVEMTLKGRLLRRFFPAIEEVSPIRLPPYTIHRNHLYRLLEDSEDDGWILDIARLE